MAAGTLAVITNHGDVFGTDVGGQGISSVFQYTGAKIGFNVQDRFMAVPIQPDSGDGSAGLAVVTSDGSVFGARIPFQTTNIGPVFQYTGARIDPDVHNRFIVAISQPRPTLILIKDDGSVFGAEISDQNIGPVFQYSGARTIGYNVQDRFMVALSQPQPTLIVITEDGGVFGAEIAGRDIGPVFQFTGARIGYHVQDRFMVALDSENSPPTLIVITEGGGVFGAEIADHNIEPVFQFTGARIGYNVEDRFMVATHALVI